MKSKNNKKIYKGGHMKSKNNKKIHIKEHTKSKDNKTITMTITIKKFTDEVGRKKCSIFFKDNSGLTNKIFNRSREVRNVINGKYEDDLFSTASQKGIFYVKNDNEIKNIVNKILQDRLKLIRKINNWNKEKIINIKL